MARFYSNENFPLQAVRELRRLGHDMLTSLEAGNANRSAHARILLTQNRLHFLRLHQRSLVPHAGIVICTYDPDFSRLAVQIQSAIELHGDLAGQLIRVNRPA